MEKIILFDENSLGLRPRSEQLHTPRHNRFKSSLSLPLPAMCSGRAGLAPVDCRAGQLPADHRLGRWTVQGQVRSAGPGDRGRAVLSGAPRQSHASPWFLNQYLSIFVTILAPHDCFVVFYSSFNIHNNMKTDSEYKMFGRSTDEKPHMDPTYKVGAAGL